MRLTVDVCVWLCVIAGIALLVCAALLPLFGVRVMVVTGGSMAPELTVGDAAVIKEVDPGRVRPGDLITFRGYGATGLTTHRVVQVLPVDGRAHYQTKGDANRTPDADLAPGAGVVGRVVARIPDGAFLFSPVPRIVVVAVPAAWVLAGEIGALRARRRRRRVPPSGVPAHGGS